MTKQCFKCEKILPVESFYAHPKMADGRLGKCKECTKKDATANRCRNLERYRDYDRQRYQTPERRQRGVAAARLHRQRHPDRAQARHAVANAVRDGRLLRKPCEVCGCEKSEAHHDDYSRPLDVRWLCRVHHRMHHGRYYTERSQP